MKETGSLDHAKFIVFDVETPNRYNDRISAIGITVVENGAVTDSFFRMSIRRHFLILSTPS